ncbi:hypothetical protein FOC4_g10000072 [Fusarium odoratissimum]|uniref:Uncharacterized protein n=1 Tax=Fusarium oxysporum f. sp. cubense (strain race 4) TaxID=2502994 RepID=N1RM27_FUSC4|nr:hypothetical protein FOC4_g10000072 [Fusarium odoratissimum]
MSRVMNDLVQHAGGIPGVHDLAREYPRDTAESLIIATHLLDAAREFRELAILRVKGWNNPKGDTFFRGFLAVALRLNPDARALAFSLPEEQGGHRVLLPDSINVERRLLDITLLAEDMGRFGLVICDGATLRNHIRDPNKKDCEARRLTTTQLALGLEHVEPGGTMTQHPEALAAIEQWKAIWRVLTFEPEECHARVIREGEFSPEQLLDEFGSDLVELGRCVWKVQAEALAKAPFT